jgi:hypothetical protein
MRDTDSKAYAACVTKSYAATFAGAIPELKVAVKKHTMLPNRFEPFEASKLGPMVLSETCVGGNPGLQHRYPRVGMAGLSRYGIESQAGADAGPDEDLAVTIHGEPRGSIHVALPH